MTKIASTCWTSLALGLAFTSTALAQTAPTDDTDTTQQQTPPPTSNDPIEVTPPPEPQATPAPAPQTDVDVDVDATPMQPQPQTTYVVPPEPVEEEEWGPLSGIGIGLAAGGGAGGFTDEEMNDAADIGGDWDVRATIGTRSPIAFEGSYIGSAQGIDALGLDNDAVLVGNGVQGALRLNATTDYSVQPFIYGGAAWRRYDLTNADVNLSDVADSDDVVEFPVGVGIAGMYEGFLFDLRGEFRASTNEDLLPSVDTLDDSGTDMHRWGAKATVGVEF